MQKKGYELFATRGTQRFLKANGVESTAVNWPDEEGELNVKDMISNKQFDLVITAKAYGPNANKPIPVRVGESKQVLTLDNDVTTTTLHFDNPTRSNTLIITPPDPQTTNEGNILGHSPRQLGIGMVEIKVVKSEG